LKYVALSPDAKDMAENMYRALWSWIVAMLVTVVVSYCTKPRALSELVSLVYGATELPPDTDACWYQRPGFWAIAVGAVFVAINIVLW
jgi:SSS family solute:Na+ symporter